MVGVLASGLGLGDTVVSLVGVLIGLLHLGRCLGAGIVVGLSEGGIVVMGGNVVVKALGGKVDVVVCMCGNVAVGGIVGISVNSFATTNTRWRDHSAPHAARVPPIGVIHASALIYENCHVSCAPIGPF